MATDAAVVTTVVASSEMVTSFKMASASSASGQRHRRNCCGTTQKHGSQDHRHRFSTHQSPPSLFFRSIKIDQLIDAETLPLARYSIVTAAENTVTTEVQAAALSQAPPVSDKSSATIGMAPTENWRCH
jgi:hypothetical protein